MKIHQGLSLLALLLLSSCAMNLDEMTPDAEIAGLDRTETDLAVWIDPAIPNEFKVETHGLSTAQFLNYRRSLENAFGATFSKYFHGVYFTDHVPSQGLMVHLYKAAPKPIALGSTGQAHLISGFSSTIQSVGMQISWYGEVYRDGQRVRRSEGKVISDERTDSATDGKLIMSDALRLMMEQFGSEIRAIADGVNPATPATAPVVVIPAKKNSVISSKSKKPSAGPAGL